MVADSQPKEQIDLMKILEDKDDMLALLQRDREFYESQDKKMRLKINNLARQVEDVQKENVKYKRLLEEMNNNRLSPQEFMKIAQQLGINTNREDLWIFRIKNRAIDSSVEVDSM